ncbi:cathepsin l1 [Anaeramoeba ignava]|uniref:Cathepsin l1 n=1 Tax=Anaeramoeba ignava TaxID=1746090 RepID=A0A9Q0LCK1_ANAIG|nr:cathepsin l1 [Anaeramoeba ignava]
MKFYLLYFLLILAFVFSSKVKLIEEETVTKTRQGKIKEDEFDIYIKSHNKNYGPEEYKARKQIYRENLERIKKHNEDSSQTWGAGENQFTDWSDGEFKAYLTKFPLPEFKNDPIDRSKLQPLTSLPDTYDLRNNITAVKNQGSCGACWAFSATAVAEGVFNLNDGILMDLSQQQVISCTTTCAGCDGGVTSYALDYIQVNGSCGDYLWGYEGQNGVCSGTSFDNCQANSFVKVKNQSTVFLYTDSDPVGLLQQILVSYGPVGIAIDADSLSYYEDGVATSMSCSNNPSNANHAPSLVGYGTDGTTPFWRVKNSWGTGWGENGFFRFERGINLCGIENYAYFATGSTNDGLTKFNDTVTGLKVSPSSNQFTLNWDSYPGAQKYFVKAIIDGELYLWETSKTSPTVDTASSYTNATCWVAPILDSQYGALSENITFNSAHSLVLSFLAFLLILLNVF